MRPEDELPPGYRRADLQERLTGLGLIVGGLALFGLVYVLWLFMPARIATPAAIPAGIAPMASPLSCMVPIVAIQAVVLVLIGLRKLIALD